MSPKTLISALRKCEYKKGLIRGNFNFAVHDHYVTKGAKAARLANKIENRLLEIVDPHKRLQRIIQKKIDADPEIRASRERLEKSFYDSMDYLGVGDLIRGVTNK